MPELPEVETVRRGLAPALVGQIFERVEVRRPDLRFPFPDGLKSRLEGTRITRLDRRAKYLVARLDSREALVMHLGMTGRFHVQAPGETDARLMGDYANGVAAQERHLHVLFRLKDGTEIAYFDPRRFGYMLLLDDATFDEHPLMRGLGAEPLTDALNAAYLAARAAERRSDLKAFLLDQRIIAGLGNIYVAEALFRTGLKPSRPASMLAGKTGKPSKHAAPLVDAIKSVLEDAITAGGSTLRDYRQADGQSGGFQAAFQVYGREGQPCVRPGCRGIVQRSIQSGRSSFHCPSCQR